MSLMLQFDKFIDESLPEMFLLIIIFFSMGHLPKAENELRDVNEHSVQVTIKTILIWFILFSLKIQHLNSNLLSPRYAITLPAVA